VHAVPCGSFSLVGQATAEDLAAGSGELQKLIDDDGLNGLTSNFTIFEKPIAESDDYSELIEELCSEANLDSVQR
jgi:transaldolase